jgi:hypothetical protein
MRRSRYGTTRPTYGDPQAPILRRYDDWGQFVEQAVNGATDCTSRTSRSESWTKTAGATWNESTDLAHHGWQEVLPEVAALTDQIKDDLRPMLVDTFASYFDVAGSQVDVDRFLMGEPENMVNLIPVKIAKPGRVISILVNGTFSAGVPSEQIKRRGIAICGLIECLELLQHSTELWVESSVQSHTESSVWTVLVKIKGAEDKLDMARVMFAIAHSAYLRRTVFSVMEQEDSMIRNRFSFNGGSYSRPVKCVTQEQVNPTLTLDLMGYTSKEGADPEQWIKDNLSEFGLLS